MLSLSSAIVSQLEDGDKDNDNADKTVEYLNSIWDMPNAYVLEYGGTSGVHFSYIYPTPWVSRNNYMYSIGLYIIVGVQWNPAGGTWYNEPSY